MIVVLREGRILVLGYGTAARGGAGRVGRAGGADADSLSLLAGGSFATNGSAGYARSWVLLERIGWDFVSTEGGT